MRPRFYFAAPYNERTLALDYAKAIEKDSGWECSSRWLTGEHDGVDPERCAVEDIDDLDMSSAVVVWLPRPSTRGGVWVEVGYALGFGMPVAIDSSMEYPDEPCVFYHHTSVEKRHIAEMAQFLLDINNSYEPPVRG